MDLVQALDGLDERPWAELTHAYGAADDVPDQLRALAGDDEEEQEEALEELWSSILHQGSVYPATAEAVPFLTRLAVAGCRPTELLAMLGYAMRSGEDDGACQEAVAGQLTLLLPLLGSADRAIRQAAAWAVGHTDTRAALEAVERRYAVEPDALVRAELLTALIRLDPLRRAELIAAALADGPPELRLAAVFAGLDAGLPWGREQEDAVLAALPADGLMAERFEDGQHQPLAGICEALLERGAREDALRLVAVALRDGRAEVRDEALLAADRVCMASRGAPAVLLPLLAPLLDAPRPPEGALRLLRKLAGQLDGSFAEPLARLASGAPAEGDEDLADRALVLLLAVAPERAVPLLAADLGSRPGALRAAAELSESADSPALPFAPELLAAVRARLAADAVPAAGAPLHVRNQLHNEPIHLAELLQQWGGRAAAAVPELLAALDRASLVVPRAVAALRKPNENSPGGRSPSVWRHSTRTTPSSCTAGA
ncbi:hypothetical protein AB0M28_06665, partial [Streptomyces sp. NPDC051940]